MVPWAEVWFNWGVRQTRFMATITFFPVPHHPGRPKAPLKSPPWKVKWGEKVLQCFNFLIWLFYFAFGITSVCQSKVCAPIRNENYNFNACVTNFLTLLSHTYTNTQGHDKAKCEIKNEKDSAKRIPDEVFWPLRAKGVNLVLVHNFVWSAYRLMVMG